MLPFVSTEPIWQARPSVGSTLTAGSLCVSMHKQPWQFSQLHASIPRVQTTQRSWIMTCDAVPPPPELVPILAHAVLHNLLLSLACDSLSPAIAQRHAECRQVDATAHR